MSLVYWFMSLANQMNDKRAEKTNEDIWEHRMDLWNVFQIAEYQQGHNYYDQKADDKDLSGC